MSEERNQLKIGVGEITKVVKAHSEYNVLRTSIPAGVRAALSLQAGDQLEWTVEPEGKRIIARVVKQIHDEIV